MILLPLLTPFFTDIPAPPPGSQREERTVEVAVTTEPRLRDARRLTIVFDTKNAEKRAYCVPNHLVPADPQMSPNWVRVFDLQGREVEFVGEASNPGSSIGEINEYLVIRPLRQVRQVIYAGKDYAFSSGNRQYVAEVVFGGFYCDELNLGRSETPILFKGQSMPFRM